MKFWKRITINVILLSAVLGSVLTIKWENETSANICSPGACCHVGSSYHVTSSGTHIIFVQMTCGSYWVYAYADGSRWLIVCPNGQTTCQGGAF